MFDRVCSFVPFAIFRGCFLFTSYLINAKPASTPSPPLDPLEERAGERRPSVLYAIYDIALVAGPTKNKRSHEPQLVGLFTN